MGAQLVREVSSKTNDVAGDGTTTATVLAYAIVREGLKAVSAGMTPIEIKRGIDKAVALATESTDKDVEIWEVFSADFSDVSIVFVSWKMILIDSLGEFVDF